MQILHSLAPDARADSLLLVYTRRIVGHLTYEVCEQCASGVITEVHVVAPLQSSGLGTRAISHLRSCYPDVTWRSRLPQRMTRDLAHRMRLPQTQTQRTCPHVRPAEKTPRERPASSAPLG
ncbi:N-acetyltransferase [Streptomyces sp. NPDC047123]|uniref:N-acetyltransferase n=1 Tax=unclassified Streptomyces TaxID=2593676 RepID=UPI0033E73282